MILFYNSITLVGYSILHLQNDPMTTANQTPREIVESFIKDMIAVYEKHKSAIEKAIEASRKAQDDTVTKESDSKKYWATRDRLSKKYGQIANKYFQDRAEVLKKYNIPIPTNFFQAVSGDCIYCGDEIVEEVIVNKNNVKIFTETGSRSYERHKIYVVQMKEGQWQLVKLRRVDEKTKKDSDLGW